MKLTDIIETTTLIPKLYLDMDGCVADFDGYFHRHISYEDKQKEIDIIANHSADAVYDMFRGLKPLKSGMAIVQWLNNNKIPFTILSAPLNSEFSQASIHAKKDWLDEHIPGKSSDAIFLKKKYIYAMHHGNPCVLIDDWEKQLDPWADAGGIAIKHDYINDPDGARTISVLSEVYRSFISSLDK